MKANALSVALVLVLVGLAAVSPADAKKKKSTATSPPDNSSCVASCQVGFTRCNQTGKDRNGNHADPVDCQRQLGECQRILCAPAH